MNEKTHFSLFEVAIGWFDSSVLRLMGFGVGSVGFVDSLLASASVSESSDCRVSEAGIDDKGVSADGEKDSSRERLDITMQR